MILALVHRAFSFEFVIIVNYFIVMKNDGWVVVTGAAGFIGSALVWDLNQRGIHNIICVDSFGKGSQWKNLSKRKIKDIVLTQDFFSLLEQASVKKKISTVFHLGACSYTTETDVDYLLKNNYEFSKKVFEWCNSHEKNLVYASSCATYGAGDLGFDDSLDPNSLVPLNPYGYSKVLMDRWVLKSNPQNFKWCGLRFSNVFGPQEYHKGDQASLVYKAYHQIKDSGSLKLFKSHRPDYKDGEQKRDFVYVKDVTSWMCEIHDAFENKTSFKNGIYNMGSGQARTWLDLATSVFNVLKVPVKIEWMDIPENIRNQYQYYTQTTMNRFFEIGFDKPRWSLELGVKDYIENHLSKEDAYL